MENYKNYSFTKVSLGIISTLLFIAVMLGVFGCNPLSIDPLAKYIIDEGTHSSYSYNYYNRRRDNIVAPILTTGNRVEFDFMFKESHRYDHTVKDGGDINKLYGITSTKIHENSARFGWRYVGGNKFEIFAYYYVRGVRGWELLTIVDVDQQVRYSVDVSNHQYTFGANGEWYHVYDTKNILAARAFPYFGGNNPAPHTMYFKIVEH